MPEQGDQRRRHDATLQQDVRLVSLLHSWEEAHAKGRLLSVEQLAGGDPDLAAKLAELIATRRKSDPSEETLATPEGMGLFSTMGLDELKSFSHDLTVGKTFGDYLLLRELGRGGMGVVFEARQQTLNRPVALKMILAGVLASPEAIKRFYAEAEAAAQLDHPGIVPIHDIGQANDQHYFSMAFVEGGSLQSRIAAAPLPPREAARIVQLTAEAVHYAHQRGIIHRDLKPHNILLDRNGQPKITDFGLAKRLTAEEALTMTGDILGTPSYMAPEQATGKRDGQGPLIDVYALGAILYCSLVGRPPFQTSNLTETLRQVVEQDPLPPRKINPALPRDLETICLKCLQKDPRQRYASAQDLADDLRRYLQGEPIVARPVGYVERTWRWCARRPAIAGLLATAALAVLIGVVAVRWAGVAQREREFAQLQTRFNRQLDELQLDNEQIASAEGLLSQMAVFKPQIATDSRARLHREMASLVEAVLDQPRLEADDVEAVKAGVKLLEPRNAALAKQAEERLSRRLSTWQEVVKVEPPFASVDKKLGSGKFTPQGDALIALPGAVTTQIGAVYTVVPADRRLEVEAVFDTSWEQVKEIGIALCESQGAYRFMVRSAAIKLEGDDSVVNGRRNDPVGIVEYADLRDARASGHPLIVEILRDSNVVARQTLPVENVPTGDLALHVERYDDAFTVQLENHPPLKFRDPLPRDSQKNAVGIILPPPARLRSLIVRRKDRPEVETSLELVNQLLNERKFSEALVEFRREEARANTDELRQECRLKSALCLAELHRVEEAKETFRALVLEKGDRWPQLAAAHLWLLHLHAKDYSAADAVFDQIATRFDLQDLLRVVPTQLFFEIRAAYAAPGYALFAKDSAPRLERMVFVSEAIQGTPDWAFRRHLMRSNWAQGRTSEALDWGEILWSPGTRSMDPAVLNYYCWLLRSKVPSPYVVLNKTNQVWSDDPQKLNPTTRLGIRLEWIREHYDRDRPANVAHELSLLQKEKAVFLRCGRNTTLDMYLIAGVFAREQGNEQRAQELWRKGLETYDAEAGSEGIDDGGRYVDMLGVVLGSLNHRSNPHRDVIFFEDTIEKLADQMPLAGVLANPAFRREFISDESLAKAMSGAFQGPQGWELVRTLAWQNRPPHDIPRMIAERLSSEAVLCDAFARGASPEQRQLVEEVVHEGIRLVVDDKLPKRTALPLAFAWKGDPGLFGWQAAESMLADMAPSRAKLRYLFAHRYAQLDKPEPALKLLQTTIDDQASTEELKSLAQESLDMFQAKEGRLALVGGAGTPLEVTIQPRAGEPRVIEVSDRMAVRLPEGEYRVGRNDQPSDQWSTANIVSAGYVEVNLLPDPPAAE